MIGDRFHLRKVLTISFAAQALCFVAISFAGYCAYSSFESGNTSAYNETLWAFMLLFALIGLISSVDLPSLISIIGNWTHRGNRGLITGLWSTNGALGNILALQMAPILLSYWDERWYLIILTVGFIFALLSLAWFLFLVPHPDEIGVHVLDEEEITQVDVSEYTNRTPVTTRELPRGTPLASRTP